MINAKILAVVAALGLSSPPTPPPPSQPAHQTCLRNCQIDESGITLLKHFEGYSPFPYPDATGIPTIGFGHVIRKGEVISAPLLGEDAETLLRNDANAKGRAVNRLVNVPLRLYQANAVIVFTFNVGEGRLAQSTLLKRVNEKKHEEVPPQFLRYDKAGGKVLKGLQRRRQAEADLYQGKR